MAVVQISRIQHRRGKKKEGTGLPQLNSGELGWAIDTQELYIGNGSVAEGAPFVGNTKVLTEVDDIFTLANQYAYKKDTVQTGESASSPYYRTLAEKLDDVVSVRDFGATGDGTDQTEVIQRAINEVYLKSSTKGLFTSRIILHFPAGEYLISGAGLYIPPFTILRGDGKDKTYITGPNAANIFRTVNGDSTPNTTDPSDVNGFSFGGDNDSLNQARNIEISGMTINHTGYGAALYLENCRESVFKDLLFKGSWSSGDDLNKREPGSPGQVPSSPSANAYVDHTVNQTGIYIDNYVASAGSDFNRFTNIDFEDVAIGVYSDYDINYNQFQTGTMTEVGYGFLWGLNSSGAVGQANGPCHNTVSDYEFILVDREALKIFNGKNNLSTNNRYRNVGNDGGNSANATYSVIHFKDAKNDSDNDFFERTADLTVNGLFNGGDYPPEILGAKNTTLGYTVSSIIGPKVLSEKFMQLPVPEQNQTIIVDYTYSATISPGPVYRKGQWQIIYNSVNNELDFQDSFTFTGNSSLTGNELQFTANRVGDKVEINVVNTTLTTGNDEFEFTIKYIAGIELV